MRNKSSWRRMWSRWSHGVIPTGFSLVGILATAEWCVAQGDNRRLTVRPHEMAAATQSPSAGDYPLDSVPDAIVTVPPQCVGARRCPLFVFLPGAGTPATELRDWLGPVANKYGMILLAPTRYETAILDAALKETLRRFVIDPAKIAIIGRCASGPAGLWFGVNNREIFSRIAIISGGASIAGLDLGNTTAEFLFDTGFLEADKEIFNGVRALRRSGRSVKQLVGLRGHEHQVEDYDFLGRWLQESWANPDPASRVAPSVAADPLPLLTTKVMTQMTTFWTSFLREPDSLRTIARRAHLREVVVPIGSEPPSTWITDIPALASQYRSVAADLKQAGLTAQQHEAYRVALIAAQVARQAGNAAGIVDPASVLAKNVAFLDKHPDELDALANAGIEYPDELEPLGGTEIPSLSVTRPNPEVVETLGALGMWRTP